MSLAGLIKPIKLIKLINLLNSLKDISHGIFFEKK